ncbi:MAG: signal peptidase II, partial [Hominimerdicola sp.]
GGIGNLIDRIRLHEVVDYIQCDFINFPIFNLADICVVIGGILFFIAFFLEEKKSSEIKKNKEKAKADE